MYLPSGMMIVSLSSYCYVPLSRVIGAFSCKDLTMSFSSELMMVHLITTHFVSFLICCCLFLQCDFISPIVLSSNAFLFHLTK